MAFFSPSSHGSSAYGERMEKARAALEGMGLRVPSVPEEQARHLYLAGGDRERAEEFESLYCDPSIQALFATRGGYGTARMLPWLDAGRIAAAPPKAVVGMSDVAALFAFLQREAGMGAVHGPCLAAPGAMDSPFVEENLADLKAILFEPLRPLSYPCRPLTGGPSPEPARGRLVGGALSVLAAGMGSPWALDCRGAILFLEEINEAPYRMDRFLTQLRQAGRFEGLAGLVFGQLIDCDGKRPGLLQNVLQDLFAEAPFPVAIGLEAGHGERNRTLPLGRLAELSLSGGEAVLECP